MNVLYTIEFKKSDGSLTSLAGKEEKVLLIVNTASKCGFTPQYKGLEALHKKYGEKGLVVLGFPCDQFGHQEPGSDDEIQQFCQLNYGVTFPVMAKIEVNGRSAHPLFAELRARTRGLLGSTIKWNFTKFLVWPNAAKIQRFEPTTEPEKLEKFIDAALGI